MAKPTMKDIAIQSGWSLGTVSNVFNHKPGVSQKAKEEILAAAQRLGYQINEQASLLRQKHPYGIALIVRSTYCPAYQVLAQGLKEELHRQGQRVYWMSVENGEDEIQKALHFQKEHPVTLLIFFGARQELFRKLKSWTLGPALSIGSDMRGLNFSNLSSYFWPYSEISQQSVEWLFESNRKHIGVLLEDRLLSNEMSELFLGVQYGFYSRNCVFSAKRQAIYKPFTLKGGYEGFKELKAQMKKLDGLLVFNSLQAMGALRAAKDLNIRIPEDLSILVLDFENIGFYTVPSLSTITSNLKEDLKRILALVKKLQENQFILEKPLHQEAIWMVNWRESCFNPSQRQERL